MGFNYTGKYCCMLPLVLKTDTIIIIIADMAVLSAGDRMH